MNHPTEGIRHSNFAMKNGIKQGRVLASTLYEINALFQLAVESQQEGIKMITRCDGNVYQSFILKSQKKTSTSYIIELLYADDTALRAFSQMLLQTTLNKLSMGCHEFGLNVIFKMGVRLSQQTHNTNDTMIIGGTPLVTVD